MFEGERVHHCSEKQDQYDLDDYVQTNPDSANFSSPARAWLFDYLSHILESPFPGLKGLIREHQHDNGHAHVENDRPRVDDTSGERSHVFDRRKIAQQIARLGGYIEQDELHQAKEKKQRNCAERNDRRNYLVPGQHRCEATNGKVKHSKQQKHQVRAEVCSGRMRSRLVCYPRENPKIKERWDPEDQVKDKGAKKFREYYLPVANRRSRQRLDRAELKFFGKQAHRDQRKNQNQRKPKEHRIEECFLDRVLHLALVHERRLEIKIDPADDQKTDHHDVRDRRVEI